MSPIFSRNAAALRRRFPHVLSACAALQQCAFNIELLQGRDATLQVNGRQLTSREDRRLQAALELKDRDLKQNLNLIGFGLGDEIRYFLQHSTREVYVYLINPGLFYLLLDIDDELHEIISHPRVHFELYQAGQKIPLNPLIIVPELYLDEGYLNDAKQLLKTRLDDEYAHRNFRARLPRFIKQVSKQADFLAHETPYQPQEWPQIQTALVLASGPSLAQRIDKVKNLAAAGAAVIAVDTALPYLHSINLIPDYVLSVDPWALLHLKDKLPADAPCRRQSALIYDVSACLSEAARFTRRRFIFTKDFIHAAPPLVEPLADQLIERGSVTITAASLALAQGAALIYLAGADFAYQGLQSHAGLNEQERVYNQSTLSDLKVLGNDGQMHITQRNFLSYKYLMEELIALHPQTRFVNLSPFGAVLKGAETA